jgi:alkyldihydroxyacetonephosphate synthase
MRVDEARDGGERVAGGNGAATAGTTRGDVPLREALRGGVADTRFDPGPPPGGDGEESLAVWGFADTRFTIAPNLSVVLTGDRYLLCGQEMPELLPWVREQFQADVGPHDTNPSQYPTAIPASRAGEALVARLRSIVGDHLTLDPEQRQRRGHGHTQAEMYAIKYGALPRVPDAVVFPGSEEEIVALVALAGEAGVVLQPYGGGTSVNQALACPAGEERPIVAVDMRRMNRIKWIDPVNRMACIQAGAVGRHLVTQLAAHGFTLGHEPDSIEFSTMGGWIATHASGMKKNRYGNIEDVVVDMRVVTPRGLLTHEGALPRESVGSDTRKWMLGCEGSFGIVTEAVVKLFPLPERQVYGSVLFPDFESGVAFMYDLAQGGQVPASVRLVDNGQLQLNFVLKPRATGLHAWKRRVEKAFVTRVKGYDPARMTACTVVYEGSKELVEGQMRQVRRLAARHGGMAGGSQNGLRGYQLTYGIAYIRDWVLNHWLIAESFETSVPWTRIVPLIEAVKRRIAAEHAARKLPGKPFVTARVTQVYPTGVCVYFYFAFYYKGVADPSHVYHEIENAAREEILAAGGSLSHHHGVGNLRRAFMPRIVSPAVLAWRDGARAAIDPAAVIGTSPPGAARER